VDVPALGDKLLLEWPEWTGRFLDDCKTDWVKWTIEPDEPPESIARRWRDRLNLALTDPQGGRPRVYDHDALAREYDRWKAAHPKQSDGEFFRKYMDARNDKDVRRCRSALKRARNSK
jgi:hypothetical protein